MGILWHAVARWWGAKAHGKPSTWKVGFDCLECSYMSKGMFGKIIVWGKLSVTRRSWWAWHAVAWCQGTHAQCHKASVNLTSAKMVFLEECSTSMPSSSVSGVPLHGHTSISQAKACQQPSQWHALGLSATWSVACHGLSAAHWTAPQGHS